MTRLVRLWPLLKAVLLFRYKELSEWCEKTGEAADEAKNALEPLQSWQELNEEEDQGGEEETKRKKAKIASGFNQPALPFWIGAEDNHVSPPPLCGRVAFPLDARVVPGDLVAANIAGGKKEGHEWILCRVERYVSGKRNFYVVADVAPEDNTVALTYDLPRRAIVPLPKMIPRTWDETTEFPAGDLVMALFPGTTSFYGATVIDSPSNSAENLYSVKFEDDDDEHGETPVRQIKPAHVVQSQKPVRK